MTNFDICINNGDILTCFLIRYKSVQVKTIVLKLGPSYLYFETTFLKTR